MLIKVGQIVKSKSGHDKGEYFVVTGFDDKGRLLLADGKRRKIEKPKAKKEKHTAPTGTVVPEEKLKTNKMVHVALRNISETEQERQDN
jgi:ribosomal protein L14E/L6E/L27E